MAIKSLIDFFRKTPFPIDRGKEKDISIYLSNHFNDFKNELNKLIDSREKENAFEKDIFDQLWEKQNSIYDFSQAIIDTFQTVHEGKPDLGKSIFEHKMLEMQDDLLSSPMNTDLETGLPNRFFRITPYEDDKNHLERKDLFHIPFHMKDKIIAHRYNDATFPCLYLCSSPSNTGLCLAWFETKSPQKIWWSEFIFSDPSNIIELLDLTWAPYTNAMNANFYRGWIIGKKPFVKELLIKYITTYPLLAACSIKVKDKGLHTPEYIIPQLLSSWVRSNDRYRGIKYYSCSYHDEARYYHALDIVLPPRLGSQAEDYCPKLAREFKLTCPELVEIANIDLIEDKERNPTEFDFIDKPCDKKLGRI